MNALTDLWATDEDVNRALGIPTDRDLIAPTNDTTRDEFAPPTDSRNTATDPRGRPASNTATRRRERNRRNHTTQETR